LGNFVQSQREYRGVQVIKAAVLGSPISHSLSPLLHKSAYEKLGLVGSYEAIKLNEVSSLEFLQPIMDRPQESDWGGFSLTMPLKEVVFSDALRSKVRIDATAAHFRTTNTLVNEGKDFFATSTDMTAFVRLLKPTHRGWRNCPGCARCS